MYEFKFRMFDEKQTENWLALVLLIVGIFVYIQSPQGKYRWRFSGMIIVLIALLLSLSARYESTKQDGTKSKLTDKGSIVALTSASLGVLFGIIITLIRIPNNPQQPYVMGIGLALLVVATILAIFQEIH